jgi:hypothetical protein
MGPVERDTQSVYAAGRISPGCAMDSALRSSAVRMRRTRIGSEKYPATWNAGASPASNGLDRFKTVPGKDTGHVRNSNYFACSVMAGQPRAKEGYRRLAKWAKA